MYICLYHVVCLLDMYVSSSKKKFTYKCTSVLQIFHVACCLGGVCSCGVHYIRALNLIFLFSSSILTQAPRSSRASLVKGRSQANAVAQQALIGHWQSIVKCIDNYLKIMRANFVSGTSEYNEMGSLFLLCKWHNALQYCDNTGPSIPSSQRFHSDIFIHQRSVI